MHLSKQASWPVTSTRLPGSASTGQHYCCTAASSFSLFIFFSVHLDCLTFLLPLLTPISLRPLPETPSLLTPSGSRQTASPPHRNPWSRAYSYPPAGLPTSTHRHLAIHLSIPISSHRPNHACSCLDPALSSYRSLLEFAFDSHAISLLLNPSPLAPAARIPPSSTCVLSHAVSCYPPPRPRIPQFHRFRGKWQCRGNSQKVRLESHHPLPSPAPVRPTRGSGSPSPRPPWLTFPAELKETHLGTLSPFSRSASTSTITEKEDKSQPAPSPADPPIPENDAG